MRSTTSWYDISIWRACLRVMPLYNLRALGEEGLNDVTRHVQRNNEPPSRFSKRHVSESPWLRPNKSRKVSTTDAKPLFMIADVLRYDFPPLSSLVMTSSPCRDPLTNRSQDDETKERGGGRGCYASLSLPSLGIKYPKLRHHTHGEKKTGKSVHGFQPDYLRGRASEVVSCSLQQWKSRKGGGGGFF